MREVLPAAEGQRIYWAFIGDAPHSWFTKKNDISDYVDGLINQITDQLNTSSFFLENDFYWEDGTTHADKKNMWMTINNPPLPEEQPRLPVSIVDGKYLTTPRDIETAYSELNLDWRRTRDDKILRRIRDIRSDKIQYEKNLEGLRSNDKVLRDKVTAISGRLYPPFPDTALYSSIFKSHEPGKIPDLTLAALFSAIESNTIYYHQELGKYNQLKKEECHLLEKFQQVQTRMKLWIARERIRLIAWELFHTKAYDDEDFKYSLREITETVPHHPSVVPPPTRTFQCVDFCQCEAGCTNLIRSEYKK
jgi:hypothetical protein